MVAAEAAGSTVTKTTNKLALSSQCVNFC